MPPPLPDSTPRLPRLPDRLRQSFYARDPRQVGPDLIGCLIVHRLPSGERLIGRIVETEAYLGDGTDPAAHSHRGPTPRNRSMFGPPGRLYAYRSYGIHTCVNVVCRIPDCAGAVLLRALEPIEGLDPMRAFRGLDARASHAALTSGPGRLAEALGLTLEHDGQGLLRPPLTLHISPSEFPPPKVESGPRVGITKATHLPYRYFDAQSDCVSPFRAGGSRRPKKRTPT